jgi:uncharacterized membrane protein
MKEKLTWVDGIVLVIWALPILYLLSAYPSLGPTLPLHFNVQGTPDRWGSRAEFVGVIAVMSGTGLGLMMLFRFLPRIDPKRKAKYSSVVFVRIGYAVVLFMSVITTIVIYAATHGRYRFPDWLMFSLLGLFFAYLGNLMNNVKPNYFFGIRTPWALENEEVWRKTHQLAARLWLPGGLLLVVLSFILHGKVMLTCYIAIVVVLGIVPVAYSYFYYRKLSR